MNTINLHTHKTDTKGIQSLFPEEKTPIGNYFSIGIHPWYINQPKNQFDLVKEKAVLKNCIAIGECGTDRLKPTPLKEQQQIFEWHLSLAKDLDKPVIIHAVKSHDYIRQSLKKYNGVKAIFHGFKQNESIFNQMKSLNSWFSFGKALFDEKSPAQEIIQRVPREHLFLETDNSDFPIESIYQKAAELLTLEIEDLASQIENNFEEVFNAKF